jgi:hypothetical protein
MYYLVLFILTKLILNDNKMTVNVDQ